MIVFIDTNIFLDVLLNREPLAESSEEVLNICSTPGFRMYTSAISFVNITYFVAKFRAPEAKGLLISLLGKIHIADTPATAFEKALQSDFKDLEDAYQFYTAAQIRGMQYLITRNGKDYKQSTLSVVTPEEFIRAIGK